MSRRTFPRAAAAGLVAAALGTPSTAHAQAPNPWRGETPSLPTASAPRAVSGPHTGQFVVGLSYTTTGGLTGSVILRAAATGHVTPASRVVTAARPACVDLDAAPGACPTPTQLSAQAVATPGTAEVTFHAGEPAVADGLKALVEATETAIAGRSPLKPVTAAPTPSPAIRAAGSVVPAGDAPVRVSPIRYMPPPAPLPVPAPLAVPAPRIIPPAVQGDVLVPVRLEGAFPEKGVRPVWTPGSNAVPHGQPQLLESVLPTANPAAQGRQ